MSLPHALLGLINDHPRTGYDVKSTFEKSIYFFWNATLPQIYRTLHQMETMEWLTSTIQHQEAKPNRKVYQVTEVGRHEFLRWLAEPPEAPRLRQQMLVKIFFGNHLQPSQFAEHLRRWRDHHTGLLAIYEKEVPPVIEYHSTEPDASENAYYWALTLDFGRRHAQMVVEWCDQALKELKRRG